jgi:cysteine synthase
VGKGVIRELGRASRLLGSNSRNKGDRLNQHPGVWGPTRPANEPTPAQAERNTNHNALIQGTGREHKAHRPGRTEVVVATHSTAGQGATPARKRGEPRPKGPTITLEGAREGNAGHDVCAKERQEGP